MDITAFSADYIVVKIGTQTPQIPNPIFSRFDNKSLFCWCWWSQDPACVVDVSISQSPQEWRETHTLATSCLCKYQVVFDCAAMATVVHLKAICIIEDIIVYPIETGTVIIVDALRGAIVGPNEI